MRTQLRKHVQNDAGVGLVEVAVAIVVLGILLVAFFPTLFRSVELAAGNSTVATANRVLAAELDTQRESQRLVCTPVPTATAISHPTGGTPVEGMTVTRQITCSPDDALATITVQVLSAEGKLLTVATTKAAVTG